MAGIVSYGGYIPRMRLSRMAVAKSMGWFAPGLFGASKGERAMANVYSRGSAGMVREAALRREATVKALNVLMLKVLEHCDRTASFESLLRLLATPPATVAP